LIGREAKDSFRSCGGFLASSHDRHAPSRWPAPRKAWEPPTCHEELFVQRYTSLRGWALRLSGGDHLEADDLLHNAFLQFVLRRRNLSEIENLEAYLFGLLRRLRLSQARNALRRRQAPLVAVDYDTAEMSLPGADARELLQVKEELRGVCEYACLRKDTSKAGSVLILRFFHGFYPKEIAKILRSPLRLANDWLRIARHEARVYLEHPSTLRFLAHTNRARGSTSAPDACDDGGVDILQQIRARIRRACNGDCLSRADVERLYSDSGEERVCCSTLSHIVSCPSCLELVARHLALGSNSDRDPLDMLGPDSGWRKDDAASRGNGRGAVLRVGGKRLRALLEHRPTELLIAANGFPLGALKVRSIDSDLELAVNLHEPIDFIEIFSEQNVRLLLFEVQPAPYGDVEQTEHVEFDDGRFLDLAVDFTNAWPSVRLAYHDAQFARLLDAGSLRVDTAMTDPLPNDGGPVPHAGAARAAAAEARVRSATPPPSVSRWRESVLRAWRAPLFRPAFSIVTLAAAALWTTLPWYGKAASASELLRGADASERALLAVPNVVVHRVLLLEERRPPARTVFSRRRVELWHDAAHGVAVRRLYDEHDRVAAGEWTQADGSRTVYRRGSAPSARSTGNAKPIDTESVWAWDPSAKHFAELVGTTAAPTVKNRGDDYLLRYDRPAGVNGEDGVVEATLTIRKAEMRAVAHTLVVQIDRELHEYAFTETTIASVPNASVPATTFDPEPELVARAIAVDAPVLGSVPSAIRAAAPPVLTIEDGNRLEVDALLALHRLEPCLAEGAQLARGSDGGLHVRASVRDTGCRARVVQRQAALGKPPALRIDVALAAVPAASAELRADVRQLPSAYRTLADRFGTQSTAAAGDEAALDAARAFGSWAEARLSSALAEARELDRLVSAWTPDRLRTLDVDRMTTWLDVVRDHARRLRRETEQVRRQIESLFAIETAGDLSPSEPATLEIRSADEVPAAVARLMALAATHDTAIRQMFEVALAEPRVPVDVTALVHSLRAGERQAGWFDEPWSIGPSTSPDASPSRPPR
jgi:DNA-directed RNA polymerase specialized sigma24 family protein